MKDYRKPLILVVDDSESNRHVLEEALQEEYEIIIASDGEAAMRVVQEEARPDLILLDVMMPALDGYEVARRLKNSPETDEIPIIFITAKDSVQDETFGLAIGALDYVTKPFHLPVVKARVRNHIRLKLQQDELSQQKMALERALVEIKTLRGFIPICSHCHQIRDDKGYWQGLEAYIGDHTDVVFSHSICPDCVGEHYPGMHSCSHNRDKDDQ